MHHDDTAAILLNCFVTERKRIMVKECCEHVGRPGLLEKACALKSWVEQRRQLQEVRRTSLLGRTHVLDVLDLGAVCALRIRLLSGLTISTDDVAIVDGAFVKIATCVMMADGAFKLLVDALPVVRKIGNMVYRCAVVDNLFMVAAESCSELARYWTRDGDELIVLL